MAATSARPLDASDLVLVMDGRLTPARAADGDFFIGRDVPSADIHLDHPAISRLHARLEPGARWRIIDFESRNGIYIDGRRVREATITDGMSVAFERQRDQRSSSATAPMPSTTSGASGVR